MGKLGLFVTLQAKPGKEKEVEQFLNGGLQLVQQEPGTRTWYAIVMGGSKYGIFDTFNDEKGREAHLSGEVAKALMAKADELFSEPPDIRKIDILASK